ncbi:opsin-5-like [Pangshura tecta]
MYNQRCTLDPQDYLTFNLAVSDAGISLFGYSRGILELFNVLRDDGFLITSVWTCKVDGFIILFFGLISINTLTAISVIRYIKGCQPHQAHKIDRKNITLTMIVIWATAFFWASAPLLGWGSYTDHKYGTCEIDWIKATFSVVYKTYVIGVFISGFFIPVSIMIFCYVSIIKTVKSSHKTTRGKKISQRQRLMERNITQVSFVICFAFFLAWSPYAVISMWSACGFQVPALTNVLASLFAKSASFYNPLIYMGMSSKFRKDIRKLFQCLNQDKDSALQMPIQMFNQRNEAAVLLKPERVFVSKVPETETPGLDAEQCSPVSNQLTAFGVKTVQRKQSGSG